MLAPFINLSFVSILFFGLLSSLPLRRPQDENLDPIKWEIKLKSANKSHKKGEQFKAALTAEIEAGWHLYALEEIPNGPRPTRISLPDEQPFILAGEIEQPVPIIKFDENFGVETQFYDGSATFVLPIKVASNANAGITKMVIQTRYQTCNDRLCLPPKTLKLDALIEIK